MLPPPPPFGSPNHPYSSAAVPPTAALVGTPERGGGQHVAPKMLFGSQKKISDRKKKNRHSLKQNQNATFLKAKKGKKVAPLFLVHFSKKNTSQKSWKKIFFQNEKKNFFCLKMIFNPFFSDFEQKNFFSIFPAFFIGADITRCLGQFS